MLRTRICPHYFIPSLNLWGSEVLGKRAEEIPSQGELGCEIIQQTMRTDISKTIIPDIFLCEIMLKDIYSLPPSQFYPRATLLLVMAESVVILSLPVIFLVVLVTIQTTVSWLLGSITCIPIIIIYSALLLTARYFNELFL